MAIGLLGAEGVLFFCAGEVVGRGRYLYRRRVVSLILLIAVATVLLDMPFNFVLPSLKCLNVLYRGVLWPVNRFKLFSSLTSLAPKFTSLPPIQLHNKCAKKMGFFAPLTFFEPTKIDMSLKPQTLNCANARNDSAEERRAALLQAQTLQSVCSPNGLSTVCSNTEAHLMIPADVFQCHPMPLCYSQLSRPQRISITLCNAVAPTKHLADVVALRHIIMVLRLHAQSRATTGCTDTQFYSIHHTKAVPKIPSSPLTHHTLFTTRQHESSRGVTWIASPL